MIDLAGKVVVVTGGNSGIGKEVAAVLAGMGARVVIAARNPTKAAAAVKEIQERTHAGDRVETMPIDLASFASIRDFAQTFSSQHDSLDVLVNNAGVILRKKWITTDGHETQFQVNHLGGFLLTHLLREPLEKSGTGRVVNVASGAHNAARKGLKFDDLDWEKRRYGGWRAYTATKLMNVMMARELPNRWHDTTVTINSLHPGFVASNFAKESDMGWYGNLIMPLSRPFSISVQQGAITPVYLASSPDVDGITGQYFAKCKVLSPSTAALDAAAANATLGAERAVRANAN